MWADWMGTALFVSLALCGMGILFRISSWFVVRIGPDARTITFRSRLGAALAGLFSAFTIRRLPGVAGAFFLDVLLQRRLYTSDKVRWFGHMLILVGFTLLLLLHALAAQISNKIFSDYYATLNPYLFLRNLFGAMAVLGVVLVFIRRRRRAGLVPRAQRPGDRVFVVLLGVVLLSGFLLEGAKIVSPKAFYRMTEEYFGSVDPDELRPLRTWWASEFSVAFDDLAHPYDAALLEEGRELHDQACASCHSRPGSAFVSYPFALAMKPVALRMDRAGIDGALYLVHVIACFLGLILLPFTRFFHALSDPISLLVKGAASGRPLSPEARVSRRALAIDACVRCGICDDHCSVAPIAMQLGNPDLLPSHKLLAVNSVAGRDDIDHPRGDRISEGAVLCTSCGRCTDRCPVGLGLEDLWEAGRGDLVARGFTAPVRWIQERQAVEWDAATISGPQMDHRDLQVMAPLVADRRTFSPCVQCQTCTNVCPVVAHSLDPATGVELTPQKVMNLLRLGMVDLAMGSRMVWNCATCYQCQENCPEGIRVTDVIFELRSLAVRRLGSLRDGRRPA
jgi:heterodisulfide reductase subunit C